MGEDKIEKNFSDDGKRYRTYPVRDPDKIALLMCMGAQIVKKDASNLNRIEFTLEHPNMVELVNALHTGRTGEFLQAEKALQYRKHVMDIIKDCKEMQRRGS